MNRQEIEALIQRWQAALNGHNVDELVDLFTDDAEFVTSFQIVEAGQAFPGKARIREFFSSMFPRYPQLRSEVDSVLIDETQQRFAVEYRWGSPDEQGHIEWVVTVVIAELQGSKFRAFRFYRRDE